MPDTITTSGMTDRLAEMYRLMRRKEDSLHSDRVRDLLRKSRDREFVIAFCGHFSAGKSTLLNGLYGKNLLPTSPIPTSANVVKVRAGENRVVLTLHSGERRLFRGDYSDDDLKRLCKRGDEVIALDIYRKDAPLPKGVALLDTPGVDSTDDAHQAATESALHLADLIFYVMDYNHVQSEVNLRFIKELSARGKRIWLVINQVDKHREEELPFDRYRERVEETFGNWGLKPEGILYTSLKQPGHSLNQLPVLREKLREMIGERGNLAEESIRREAAHLVREHLSDLKERNRANIRERKDRLGGELPSLEELDRKLGLNREERERLVRERDGMEVEFLEGLEEILANAYLMPYENRELAHLYLETVLSRFRVGWFFSGGKTAKEKERRFRTFYEKLKQTVDTQLDVHVKQYLIRYLKEKGLYSEERGEAVYELASPLDPDWLRETVREGAGLTGDYLLKYTGDLADRIKGGARRQAKEYFDSVATPLLERIEADLARAEEEEGRLRMLREAARDIGQILQEEQLHAEGLRQVLEGEREPEVDGVAVEAILGEEAPITSQDHLLQTPDSGGPVPVEPETPISGSLLSARDHTEEALRYIREAEAGMADVRALAPIRRELAEKRKRVENRRFTVALFGAFSAGKSSFANALMGESVLPVSPHPTTAAINRITAPDPDHAHGEVLIRFKTETALLDELKQAWSRFGKEVSSLAEAVEAIRELGALSEPDPGQKTVLPFLRAVEQGYGEVSGDLGNTRRMSLKDFGQYVAVESRSCFVELAELYFDCPLTRQGITLVDTPGADSIHARHTETAFRYIKEADAVLFVTYYNHAFSRADREFLIQLGRVKDAFAMDKMFFVMNAADLAASAEEQEGVMAYLREQLLGYGIRHPRLFAVSSLLALQGGEQGQPPAGSGMAAFEQAFAQFLNVDLMSVSLHGMKSDLERAQAVLGRLSEDARRGNEEKRERKAAYAKERQQVLQLLSGLDPRTDAHALGREIEELLYYVRQRLFLRYQDVFVEIFHSSVLSDSSRVKERLRGCMREIIQFLRHELLQELRATSLRVDRWISGRLEEHATSSSEACRKLNESLPPGPKTFPSVDSPGWREPFPELDVDSFKKAATAFKNSRDFFENNGRARMRDRMKPELEKAVDAYLEEERSRWIRYYEQEWREAVDRLKQKMVEDVQSYYDPLLEVLSEQVDPAGYDRVLQRLEESVGGLEQILPDS
ncbi:dynamin family protein [Kroppenstedtia eburnea]|uniref:dynamin family protein n=1 Tax=Kroppenstedtia eburnea TaxID=714067 RepID=UPI00362F759B